MFVLVALVGVFILWRIYKLMALRMKVEAATAVAMVETHKHIAKLAPIGQDFEQAKQEGRLLEWVEKMGRYAEDELNATYAEFAERLPTDPNIYNALKAEQAKRQILCRYLVSESVWDAYYNGFDANPPGERPAPMAMCVAICKGCQEGDVYPEHTECPYCGGAVEVDPPEAPDVAEWEANERRWSEYRKRHPERAQPLDAEYAEGQRQAEAKRKARFDAALAKYGKGSG